MYLINPVQTTTLAYTRDNSFDFLLVVLKDVDRNLRILLGDVPATIYSQYMQKYNAKCQSRTDVVYKCFVIERKM